MKEFLLGIDIGSSALKMVVARADGEIMASVTAPYATRYPRPGWAEQNPEDWWQAICDNLEPLLRRAGIDKGALAAIGVDGYSWAVVALDSEGRVLADTPLWYDTRATSECDQLRAAIGDARAFSLSGNPIHPNYALPKALWLQKKLSGVSAPIRVLLQTNGYIVYRLTGALTQDLSQAYGYACFDVRKGAWDDMALGQLPFPAEWLPAIVPCHQVVGVVTAAAAKSTGLPVGVPVVAGGLDAACGTLGAGVLDAGQTQEQGGQAGGVSICMDQCQPQPQMILSPHVVPGRFLLQGGTVGGGGVMRWLAETLYPEEASPDGRFQAMDALAAQVPPGSDGLLFLPYMAGERSPIWDDLAKGVYFGLDFAKTRGHMIRAALEGTAYALRHNLDAAGVPGMAVTELRAVGGAAASPVWMQIKADTTGLPIRSAGAHLTTAVGALILAGVGAGLLPSFAEACLRFTRLEAPYVPDASRVAVYTAHYARYRKLYPALLPLMHQGDFINE